MCTAREGCLHSHSSGGVEEGIFLEDHLTINILKC